MAKDPQTFQLPFVVRDMLNFEGAVAFDIELLTAATTVTAIELIGITREGPFRFNFITGNDSTMESRIFAIPDIPILITVRVVGTDDVDNGVYAIAYLRINKTRTMLMCQGMLGSYHSINWPNQAPATALQKRGKFNTLASTNPAAGAQFSITIPANEWWLIKRLVVSLVTDATAVSRRLRLTIDDGTGSAVKILSAADQTASTTVIYSWFEGAGVINDATGLRQNMPLPGDFLLPPGSVIASESANFQAGDNLGSAILIGELFYSPNAAL